jgi:hypothetical protein
MKTVAFVPPSEAVSFGVRGPLGAHLCQTEQFNPGTSICTSPSPSASVTVSGLPRLAFVVGSEMRLTMSKNAIMKAIKRAPWCSITRILSSVNFKYMYRALASPAENITTDIPQSARSAPTTLPMYAASKAQHDEQATGSPLSRASFAALVPMVTLTLCVAKMEQSWP